LNLCCLGRLGLLRLRLRQQRPDDQRKYPEEDPNAAKRTKLYPLRSPIYAVALLGDAERVAGERGSYRKTRERRARKISN
jgi:hypothetical protein